MTGTTATNRDASGITARRRRNNLQMLLNQESSDDSIPSPTCVSRPVLIPRRRKVAKETTVDEETKPATCGDSPFPKVGKFRRLPFTFRQKQKSPEKSTNHTSPAKTTSIHSRSVQSGSLSKRLFQTSSNRSSRSILRFVCDDKLDEQYGNENTYTYFHEITNNLYKDDDVSSLHFDEYGYDVTRDTQDPNRSEQVDGVDDDDDISDFFKAPTRKELSKELFHLVDQSNTCSDSLKSLGKLHSWSVVAETDPITAKHFVDYQVVSTLLYFVRNTLEKRRTLRTSFLERWGQKHHDKENRRHKTKNNESKGFLQSHLDFVNASNNYELCLHQTMKVILECTRLYDNGTETNESSQGLQEAVLIQLVEIDGVGLLVTVLEEQLDDQIKRLESGDTKNSLSTNTETIVQYSNSVSRSIWDILMNVGASETAVRLLKETQHRSPHQQKGGEYSMARKLVAGITIGLNHRFFVSKWDESPHKRTHCVMSDDREKDSSSLWLEDMFVALCRLVGSKDVDDEDSSQESESSEEQGCVLIDMGCKSNELQYDEHDEIRSLLIEMCLVKKCLKVLVDEPNAVFGQNPFVTTLAMSFFYACLRFGNDRYPRLREYQEQDPRMPKQMNPYQMVSKSMDFDRLVHFTLQSLQSFPSDPLVQGTGYLILDSIPSAYKFLWQNDLNPTLDCCQPPTNDKGDLVPFVRHKKSIASLCVGHVIEPCSWYCPTTIY